MRGMWSGVGAVCVALAIAGTVATRPAAAGPEEPPEALKGEWKLTGWNVGVARDGAPSYTGTVSLDHRGKGTFLVTWSVGGKKVNEGVGLWDGRTRAFASGYAIQGQAGVAIFQLSQDGKVLDCVGTFKGKIGEVAYEEWKRE